MRMPLISSVIFTAIGVSLPVAAHAADMNPTHIYNPRWPPHAKFHDGQTLSLSLLLGGLTTFLAWRSSSSVRANTTAAACVASLYFISQATAILYPGTAYVDPEFPPNEVKGVPSGIVIDAAYLSAISLAAWLAYRESRRFGSF